MSDEQETKATGVCVSCRYWAGYRHPAVSDHTAECRRSPPQKGVDEDGDEAHLFPITSSYDWCGEYAQELGEFPVREPVAHGHHSPTFAPTITQKEGAAPIRYWPRLKVWSGALTDYEELCAVGLVLEGYGAEGGETVVGIKDPLADEYIDTARVKPGKDGNEDLVQMLYSRKWRDSVPDDEEEM